MTTRGTLYRCHLFSFGGPQTTGVTSRWLYEFQPFDGGNALSGDVVQLHTIVVPTAHRLSRESRIRFDILEEDFLLGGGLDDKIVSLVGSNAPPPDDGFRVEPRMTRYDVLDPGRDFREYAREYRRTHPDDFGTTILVLAEPSADQDEDEAADLPRQYHVLTWWLTEYDSEIGKSEFYFIVNIDAELDDQSEDTLDVSSDRAPGWEHTRGMWSVQTATRRLHELLAGNLFTGTVDAAAARAALDLMRELPGLMLLDVVMRLRLSGTWRRFAQAAQEADVAAFIDLELRIEPNYGYIVPGDHIEVSIRIGSLANPEVSGTFEVRDPGVDLPHLHLPVPIIGLLPVDAADTIARAYAAAEIFVSPSITLKFVQRGAAYAGHPNRLAEPANAIEHLSRWFPDPQDPTVRRRNRRGAFSAYIASTRPQDQLTINALGHYFHWLEVHGADEELFNREPYEIWELALQQASAPPPVTPLTPFLALQRSVLDRLGQVAPDEKHRLLTALDRFGRWIDQHKDDPDLVLQDAVQVWATIAARVAVEEVQEEVRREAARRAAEPPPLDWDGIGRKIDAALLIAQTRIWRLPEAQVEETVVESGGFLGFFTERHGYSYLILPSDLEKVVRDQIAHEYLRTIFDRTTSPDFLQTTAEQDFRTFRERRPELIEALVLAYEHPYVEKSEFEVELEDWQMAIEIGIGFIPIVGQIVGGIEVASGQSLFGRNLSTVERGITGAAILLPAAGKIFGTGRRLVTASQIARDYRLTAGEANAVYRAAFHVRPGSIGDTLLKKLLPEIQAGRPITDRALLRQAATLLQEMGMTERATAQALGLPVSAPLQAAELATVDELERFVVAAVGDETRALQQLRALPQEAQDALRAAVRSEPEWLRQTIQRELQGTLSRYTDVLRGRMRWHDMPDGQADALERAVGALNTERRAVLAARIPAIAAERVTEMASPSLLRSEGNLLLTELRRRRDLARAAGQTSRVTALDRRIARTQQWLNGPATLQTELDELSATVGRSTQLTDLVATLGAQPTLRRLWIQYRLLQAGRGTALTFEEYVTILGRHFRGNFGEFEVAFRLGRTHILLKAPDGLVTLPGTDLVAIPRTGGDLLLIDNKALAAAQVDEVSALTRNLPRNIGMDLNEFSRLANDADVPVHMQLAINRLTRAQTQLQPILQGLTREQIAAPAVQAQIDAVLRANRIQRVVTNAGGNVQGLSADLQAIGLDLRDLN